MMKIQVNRVELFHVMSRHLVQCCILKSQRFYYKKSVCSVRIGTPDCVSETSMGIVLVTLL
jgi:hypothetical protein